LLIFHEDARSRDCPIWSDDAPPVLPYHQVSRWQFRDTLKRRPVVRAVSEGEDQPKDLGIGEALDFRMKKKRLDFGRECDPAAAQSIVQRLHPDSVARQNQTPFPLVAYGNGKHSR